MTRAKAQPRSILLMAGYRLAAIVQSVLSERWRVQRAGRTEEIIWRLRSGSFSAVLLGLQLSHESGPEALEDILRALPEIPVVVLAEPGLEAAAARALLRGAASYVIAGPALPLLLEAVIERAVLSAHLRRVQAGALELEHQEQVRNLALAIRHEINNPLTAILGNAEIALKAGDLSTGQQRRLAGIVRQAEEIRSLLQELEVIPERSSRLWKNEELRMKSEE